MNNNYNLPNEIYNKIFYYINDTETYCNVRVSSKLFNSLLRPIIIFKNKEMYEQIIFTDNIVHILDKNNKEKGFYNKYTHIYEYKNNNEVIKIDTSNPYKMKVHTDEIYLTHTKHVRRTHNLIKNKFIERTFSTSFSNQCNIF